MLTRRGGRQGQRARLLYQMKGRPGGRREIHEREHIMCGGKGKQKSAKDRGNLPLKNRKGGPVHSRRAGKKEESGADQG